MTYHLLDPLLGSSVEKLSSKARATLTKPNLAHCSFNLFMNLLDALDLSDLVWEKK